MYRFHLLNKNKQSLLHSNQDLFFGMTWFQKTIFFFQNENASSTKGKIPPESRTRAFVLTFVLDPQVAFHNETEQGAKEYIDVLEGALLLRITRTGRRPTPIACLLYRSMVLPHCRGKARRHPLFSSVALPHSRHGPNAPPLPWHDSTARWRHGPNVPLLQ